MSTPAANSASARSSSCLPVPAAAATRYMEGLLYGVTARDPLTFAAVGAGFLAVAIAASCLPARQAATVDPLTTLRAE